MPFASQAYGLQFLRDVHIPDGIIERVLADAVVHAAERRIRHVSYTTEATIEAISPADLPGPGSTLLPIEARTSVLSELRS